MEIKWKDSVDMAGKHLKTFAKAYKLNFSEKNGWELPNLNEEQIKILLLSLPGFKSSDDYLNKVVVPNLLSKQNTEPKWWLRQLSLLIHEYKRLELC